MAKQTDAIDRAAAIQAHRYAAAAGWERFEDDGTEYKYYVQITETTHDGEATHDYECQAENRKGAIANALAKHVGERDLRQIKAEVTLVKREDHS